MKYRGWQCLTIDDVCTVTDCLHKTAPKVNYETEFKMLRTSNIRNGRIDRVNVNYVTEEIYEAWSNRGKLEVDDVILTREAPMGEVGIIKTNDRFFLGQRMLQLKAKRDVILPDFLYYSLQTPYLQHQIKMNEGTGSVVSNIRIPLLKKMKIFVPSIQTQERLVRVLKLIDEKIEVNSQSVSLLEQIAHTIFKRWFIDFEFPYETEEPYKTFGGEMVESDLGLIPKGWKIGNLEDLITIGSGKRPKKNQEVQDADFSIPIIGASKVMGYTNDFLFNSPIIVTGRVGTHGIVQRLSVPCWPSDNTLVIQSKYYEFVYQFLKHANLGSLNRGSTQPLITQTDIKKLKLVIPCGKTLSLFEKLISKLFLVREQRIDENNLLTHLRDSLLPKLLSGEIEVTIESEEEAHV
ncbi:restriction endonuclease subunit S [Metabacillus indicus]|uniref:restriction endonuclease subunit S n=1 Tax=Metabacillus indicus TaxID=246786 RepID=UPI002492021B|nr:restriction endonuclease subunit S [Metabacillus indicus]